ncbi:MAG: ATP-binding protein [Cyanobacteria bacterium P01_A01_bin.84]
MDTREESDKNRELEKENRILQKKLKRCENERKQLETDIAGKEFLLKKVINELEESRKILAYRSKELETTLQNLQTMQVQIVQSEKMSALGQMVAGIAHEINNPVNFIHANITHLEEYSEDMLCLIALYKSYFPNPPIEIQNAQDEIELEYLQADLNKILQSMSTGTERIREIVLSLRNFSRLDESEVKEVDIHEGIESTLLILKHRLEATSEQPGIEITRDYGTLPLVKCYPGQLNQVFMNILLNAIYALEELHRKSNQTEANKIDYQIQIRTSVVDSFIEIVIADNGIGIPESIQKEIFNPFFTTKPVGKGTGMGMSISYQIIVEKHGGKLNCFSNVGKGTEFAIQIPTGLRQK